MLSQKNFEQESLYQINYYTSFLKYEYQMIAFFL